MRDLITLIEQFETLDEGRGLAARSPGEQFANKEGDVIEFQSLDFYPERGKFPPGDDMALAISELKKQGVNIQWTNQAAANSGGFGVATFKHGDNNYYLGRFFKEISPSRVANNFPHDAIPGGFKLQSGLGKKESAGYKPSEVLKTFKSNSPESIVQQITNHFGASSDEAVAAEIFLTATQFPVRVPSGNMNISAFNDYFCEMLQPMALVLGLPTTGNAGEAAEIFFGPGQDFSGCVISFNEGVSGGLYDSLLVNSAGKQIKISSKGKSGANASVVNLLRCMEELQAAPNGPDLLSKHQIVVDIIKIIDKKGHFGAPIELATNYGIIDTGDGDFVLGMKQYGPEDEINWGKHKKLQALYQGRRARDMSRIVPIEHMIAAIAYRVADYVNKNTEFDKAAADILNHSALVQMYTTVTKAGDEFVIPAFKAVYPSEAVTGVLLDATKAYMSTQGKGNFTFEILKGGAKPSKSVDPDSVQSAEPVAKPNALTGKKVDIRPIGAAPKPKKADLGRERR